MNSSLWTLEQVADWLSLSTRTIKRMVYRNEIPHVKVGACLRFDPELLDKWFKAKSQPEESPNATSG